MMSTGNKILELIRKSLVELDEENFLALIDKALELGIPVEDIVFNAMKNAMDEIGKLFEIGEYFLAELMVAADLFRKAMNKLNPLLEDKARSMGGKQETVVIGTVKGDIHDIGKSLVATMLSASGYKVVDLGVNVEAKTFVEAVKKYKPKILGMSALLTTTARNMAEVIEELKREGIRDKVRVVIGGAATTPDFARKIGADAWAGNAIDAVKIINKLVSNDS